VVGDVIEKVLFDTIYHEHVSYHSVKPLDGFLTKMGFRLIDVQRVDTHGGSIRCVAAKGDSRVARDTVAQMIEREEKLGLADPKSLSDFSARIEAVKHELTCVLDRVRADGKRIIGFGAPAKATTLMHHFDIGPEIIEFIVDDSVLKQGLYTPGYHIPVVAPLRIYEESPDFVLILAWNFARPIMKSHGKFVEQGGRFIVPLPNVEVL